MFLMLTVYASLLPALSTRAQEKPRLDRYGDPLPKGAVARLGSSRYWHGLSGVALSPDAKVLASGGHDHTIHLMDAATGRELRRLGGPDAPQRPGVFLAFSPNGKTLAATAADDIVRLYDLATGKEIRQLRTGPGGTFAVAYSPDGKLLAASSMDGTIRLWDMPAGKLRDSVAGQADVVPFFAFSPDGKMLAFTNKEMIRLWDLAAGKELRQLAGPARRLGRLAFSTDGKLLAAAGGQTVHLWEPATGKAAPPLGKDLGNLGSVAFSPGGKLVACGNSDGTIHILDLTTGRPVSRLDGHLGGVWWLVFAPDGKTLLSAGSWGAAIHVWDVATGKEIHRHAGHTGVVSAVAFAPDGRTLFSHGWDGKLLAWDLATTRESLVAQIPTHPGSLTARFSSDAKFLAAPAGPEAVGLWNASTGRMCRRIPTGPVTCLALTPGGTVLATAGLDKTVRLWEVPTGKERHQLQGGSEPFRGPVFSPDGKTLAAMTQLTIHVWDTSTGRGRQWAALPSGHMLGGLIFAPDGRTLVSCEAFGKPARFWSVATGQEIHPLIGPVEGDWLAFSPDGRLQATLNHWTDSTLRLFETATGQEVRRFERERAFLSCLSFAPDSRTLATSSDGTILLWDVVGEMPRARLAAAELDRLWADLGDPSPQGYQALWRLAAVPEQMLPWLRARLRPATAPARQRVARLLADLASERFAVRDQATRQLEELAELAAAELRQALEGQPPLEVRRRIEQLLARHSPRAIPSGERLRRLRAVAALEHLGTAEARERLRALAGGAAEARLTQEARTALERLEKRAPAP
jgi:WD40 repeat protein